MTVYPAAGKFVIQNEELLNILPHKGKMLLISRILEYDIHARVLCSEYDIGESCLFYDPALGGVPVWISFEFMAQAVSALSGLTGKIMGKPPMIGFILSVASMKIKVPVVTPGETIRVRITEEMRVGDTSTFHCTMFSGETEAATARLMVMDVENPAEFMEKGGM